MSFKKHNDFIKEEGESAVPRIYKKNRNVFLVITRTYNGNVVVYESILDSKRTISKLDTFWLDIDNKYQQKARKRKKPHDRVELNTIEKYGFGINVLNKNGKKWEFNFKQFKTQTFSVEVHDTGVSCFTVLNGKRYKVHHLHIESSSTMLIPTVKKVVATLCDLDKKQFISTTVYSTANKS